MKTLVRYADKFANFCFFMLLGNLGLFAAFTFAMMPLGFFTGSWRQNITISGPPSLDSASIPWDVHAVHVAAHYLPWIELWTLLLGLLPYTLLILFGLGRHGAAAIRRGFREL